MCELLGISASRPVNMNFSFPEWRHRGRGNPHGHGFAYWDDGRAVIVKEPRSLWGENQNPVRTTTSGTFVCHVRSMSVGSRNGANTHPFSARTNGRTLVFAHNGTVEAVKRRPLRKLQPEGATDSEHAFLWMLERLEGIGPDLFPPRLKELADDVAGLGNFNFLLSDGETLWAYADNSLHFIERTPPYGGELVRLRDEGYSMSLDEVKAPDERAVLVATQPLTDEQGWKRMERGSLLVVRAGGIEEVLPPMTRSGA